MKKLLIVIVFIGALAGIGYFATRESAVVAPAVTETAATSTPAETKTVKETATGYTVDVDYRLTGNAVVDAHIEAEVQKAITAFKKDAANFDPAVESRPYSFTGDVASVHTGADIISERINLYQDTGGAHGLPIVLTLNYDARTGETITLDRALSLIGMSLNDVSTKALAQLKQEFGTSIFADGAAPKAENYSTFVVTPQNVTFVFQPYQVVAYAAGMPEVTFARK